MSQKLPVIASAEAWSPTTEIHATTCKHCPSAHNARLGITDPESADIKAGPRAYQIESVFRCAWRTEKACKGYCDFLGVTEADLQAAEALRP